MRSELRGELKPSESICGGIRMRLEVVICFKSGRERESEQLDVRWTERKENVSAL